MRVWVNLSCFLPHWHVFLNRNFTRNCKMRAPAECLSFHVVMAIAFKLLRQIYISFFMIMKEINTRDRERQLNELSSQLSKRALMFLRLMNGESALNWILLSSIFGSFCSLKCFPQPIRAAVSNKYLNIVKKLSERKLKRVQDL